MAHPCIYFVTRSHSTKHPEYHTATGSTFPSFAGMSHISYAPIDKNLGDSDVEIGMAYAVDLLERSVNGGSDDGDTLI